MKIGWDRVSIPSLSRFLFILGCREGIMVRVWCVTIHTNAET
jgi:hypothetical protein